MNSKRLATSRTRRLKADDLAEIAILFEVVFRSGRKVRINALIEHMRAVYLGGPWFDPDICSIVHLAEDGRIDGFFGVNAMPMLWRGEPVRAGVTGTFMVRDPAKNPMAAIHMARTYLAGPQDLTISDTVNRFSLDLSQEMKFAVLGCDSLEWFRVLRAGGFGQEMLRRRGLAMLAWLGGVAVPLVNRRLYRFADEADAAVVDRDVDLAGFIETAAQLSRSFELRPAWDQAGLEWQLRLASDKLAHGPLHMRDVRGKSGRLSGAYLYYGRPGGVAVVLQVVTAPGMATRVLRSLCQHAVHSGCVAIRGRTHPAIMDGLFRMPNVFYRHLAATVVHSSNHEIVTAAMAGQALVGGLVGDSWTRLDSDAFD